MLLFNAIELAVSLSLPLSFSHHLSDNNTEKLHCYLSLSASRNYAARASIIYAIIIIINIIRVRSRPTSLGTPENLGSRVRIPHGPLIITAGRGFEETTLNACLLKLLANVINFRCRCRHSEYLPRARPTRQWRGPVKRSENCGGRRELGDITVSCPWCDIITVIGSELS